MAQGRHSAGRARRGGRGRRGVLAVLVAAGVAAAVTGVQAVAVPRGLAVSGHELLRDGRPQRLDGVTRSGTESACVQGWGVFDGPSDLSSIEAIAAWRATVVRVPLNADCWLPKRRTPRDFSGAAYRRAVTAYATRVHAAGMSVILVLDRTSRGPDGLATGQDLLPESGDAGDVWASVAGAFKDDPDAVLELYSAPHGVGWDCWRDGCTVDGTAGTPGYRAAGMQEMLDAVRGAGARNLVIATAPAGSDLREWPARAPRDPAGRLAAGLNLEGSPCRDRACWDREVAPVAARYPVVTTGLGRADGAEALVPAYTEWADGTPGISYLFSSWNTSGPSPLVSAYDGTPRSAQGSEVRSILGRRSDDGGA